MKYTVFLDRDGVINQDSSAYIKSPDEFHFIPKSCEAISLLTHHGFNVILITNQSAIGRKMITQRVLDTIFDKLKTGVTKAGGHIMDIFFCPHTPDAGCDCRKPLPGMITRAQNIYNLDPDHCMMVGDSAKDIECGLAGGCAKTLLVATGNGEKARKTLAAKGIFPDFYGKDLFEAALWIIRHVKPA
ncbi:MAG: D-glycero-beta-D-manno-heptose 1,7-bisphosphate 7-phosphatase [Desulfobacteraceae bacterium]|nr:D-glycero-beta-D-manno-heptose 1,7-bisphosphate 7-phosphatase [Desulfobacteraceae bacterium]